MKTFCREKQIFIPRRARNVNKSNTSNQDVFKIYFGWCEKPNPRAKYGGVALQCETAYRLLGQKWRRRRLLLRVQSQASKKH